MRYKAIRGMEDILPQDIRIWQELERIARRDLESYGYVEIRTPILEDTSIFVRSIGEATDIVAKEMYTFQDKKERSFTLRPEGTAPIVRAYIEHSLDKVSHAELKLYYIGPMFRAERPQAGRSRQFHQIGVEIFGTNSPYADAELIAQMNNMLKLFGLSDFTIKLNTLGCKKDKADFSVKLKDYLKGERARLCADCKERIEKNVLRVLDCKNETCKQVIKNAPDIIDSLCSPCRQNYESLKNILKSLNVDYVETKNLVRGLDYYTGLVFEVVHPALGSQDAIGAGGRYDNLVRDLGGPDTGAVGYALGVERIILALKRIPQGESRNVVYIASLGDGPKIHGINIAAKLREKFPFIVLTDIKGSSLKSQMRNADRNNARLVLIIGDEELKSGKITLRDMRKKEQQLVDVDTIIEEVEKRLG